MVEFTVTIDLLENRNFLAFSFRITGLTSLVFKGVSSGLIRVVISGKLLIRYSIFYCLFSIQQVSNTLFCSWGEIFSVSCATSALNGSDKDHERRTRVCMRWFVSFRRDTGLRRHPGIIRLRLLGYLDVYRI